jgi:hypothetical protein
MPGRVEFTRRSWLVSTIFDGIRDFADPGDRPTTKNPTPILDSARSADAGRHVGFATGARVSAITTCRRSMRLSNPSAARQQKETLPIVSTTRHTPAARCRRQDNAPARQARSPRTTFRSGPNAATATAALDANAPRDAGCSTGKYIASLATAATYASTVRGE